MRSPTRPRRLRRLRLPRSSPSHARMCCPSPSRLRTAALPGPAAPSGRAPPDLPKKARGPP
uniref:Uncharacterized protein n=1 Tax=Arundo donax TaxID=35708 RepID=A0A0A8YF69_ARUDO